LEALRVVKPGFDFPAERRARAGAGIPDELRPDDLYPDALPCIAALRAMGFVVGAAGNTGVEVEGFLRAACGLRMVASSAGLRAAKPAPGFFAAIARLAGFEPAAIAYVGDRVDNDILPALDAGMLAVHSGGGRGATSTPSGPRPGGRTSASTPSPSSRPCWRRRARAIDMRGQRQLAGGGCTAPGPGSGPSR
jgi:FMN phosphatase YigB (HAD superfamily)